MKPAMILKENSLTFVVNSEAFNVDKTHRNFEKIKDLLRSSDWDESKEKALIQLASLPDTIKGFSEGNVSVQNGQVEYKGTVMDNHVATMILDMAEEGFDCKPMMRFLDNLMDNPSFVAVEELMLFMKHNNIPITEDGCILAYKKVGPEYMDLYSNTIDNSVGQVVEMPRNQVDNDRHNTCSKGLHFCSIEYLPKYRGGIDAGNHVMILKINPRDVVSIPSDYNNAKGRCCRYEVIGEHNSETEEAFSKPVEEFKPNTPIVAGDDVKLSDHFDLPTPNEYKFGLYGDEWEELAERSIVGNVREVHYSGDPGMGLGGMEVADIDLDRSLNGLSIITLPTEIIEKV